MIVLMLLMMTLYGRAQTDKATGTYRTTGEAGAANAVFFYINRRLVPDTIHLSDALSPYVGYKKNDKYLDWYFDTFIPVANFRFDVDRYPLDFSYNGWMTFTGILFDKYYDFAHYQASESKESWLVQLDKKIAEVATFLGDDTTRHNVIVPIPFPPPGKKLYPTTFLNKRLNVMYDLRAGDGLFDLGKWYIDTVISKWNALQLKKLSLIGFYWMREDIPDSEYVGDGIGKISDYLRKKGLGLYMSPYLRMWTKSPTSSIPEQMSKYFKCVWLQPGFWTPGHYGAKSLADSVRLLSAADLAANAHFGINMEWHGGGNSTYFRYLSYGYEAGYVYASHLFYEDNGSLWVSANSNNPAIRRQYDETYRFIKTSRKRH